MKLNETLGVIQPRPRPLLGWLWQVSLAGLVNFRLAFGNYRNGHLPRPFSARPQIT
jgi:hypothetical protein